MFTETEVVSSYLMHRQEKLACATTIGVCVENDSVTKLIYLIYRPSAGWPRLIRRAKVNKRRSDTCHWNRAPLRRVTFRSCRRVGRVVNSAIYGRLRWPTGLACSGLCA